ncbi:hypothetical protein NEOLEDRAFT_818027 [Neolentinus lepideus HHB14362 ss-1]|uniref:Uncharacterized protein n=1 Tax=Neolentinus lepideus HHB14362 ss-1 TaxID=1314782 RepID=A0A165PDF2_9AGAM|nr:hypothetical protein NEOLEDRAFT_818027 [Neolentinus lepideus HHB14362 ss-1]
MVRTLSYFCHVLEPEYTSVRHIKGYLNSSDIRTVLVAADPARESRNVMNPMRLTRVRVEGLVRSKSARRERRCRRSDAIGVDQRTELVPIINLDVVLSSHTVEKQGHVLQEDDY